MATILMPVPSADFDPTETGVPWTILDARGHTVAIATPDGRPATADPVMVTGKGLGLLASVLRADANGRAAYDALTQSRAFLAPLRYQDLRASDFDALMLPGGHARGMRPYLESPLLQALVVDFFAAGKPVGAICHGALLAARSRTASARSVLHGRRTTGLRRDQELLAWGLTCTWLGSYYRTYPTPLETEIRSLLASPDDFDRGPLALTRDSPRDLTPGFTLRDGNYLSARWPGDAHRFGHEFAALVEAYHLDLDAKR